MNHGRLYVLSCLTQAVNYYTAILQSQEEIGGQQAGDTHGDGVR
jgi:hypothetical protein